MKAYGIPRDSSYAYPDKGDIRDFGLPGCAGSFPGKGGEYRSHFKNAAAKAATRRIYKRRARAEGKAAARSED